MSTSVCILSKTAMSTNCGPSRELSALSVWMRAIAFKWTHMKLCGIFTAPIARTSVQKGDGHRADRSQTEGFGCIPSSFVTELSWAENDSNFAKSRFPEPCLARVLTLLPPWIGLALGVPRFDSYLQVYRHNQYQKTDKMHCM